jgi:hypothetical protein
LQIADSMNLRNRLRQREAAADAQHTLGDAAGARATLAATLRLAQERFEALKPDDADRPPRGKSEHDQLLMTISHLQAKLDDQKGALATMDRISNAGEKIAALTDLARARTLANDLDGALEAVGLINGPKAEAEALEVVVAALGRQDPANPVRTPDGAPD